MAKVEPIIIPADQVDAFKKFAVTALALARHPNNLGVMSLKPYQESTLAAYVEAARLKQDVVLAAEDVSFIIGLKRFIDYYAQPSQLPLFGEGLDIKIIEAKNYLDQLIPKEMLPEPRRR